MRFMHRSLTVAAIAVSTLCTLGHAQVVYVDQANATGPQDGASWATAFVTLQAAVDAAAPGDELWIAAGVYGEGRVDEETGRRTGALHIDKALTLYGGFAGTEESLEGRAPDVNVTVIDGTQALRPVGAPPLEAPTPANRANNVVWVEAGVTTCVLDGLTIRGGLESFAKATPPTHGGGGVYWRGESGEIRNCTFEGNLASRLGGAVYVPDAEVRIADSRFVDNGTIDSIGFGYGGGAVAGNPALTVERCTFIGNSTNGVGGALRDAGLVRDSRFEENAVDGARLPRQGGGAIADVERVENCVFLRNAVNPDPDVADLNARGWGGAGRAGLFVNCVFIGNTAGAGGGAIATENAADPASVLEGEVRIVNCSFYANLPQDLWVVSRDASVENSALPGGIRVTAPAAVSVATSWTSGAPGYLAPEEDDLRPRFDSPLINGADAEVAPETDLDGVARPQFGVPDIGAYEFEAAANPSEVGLIVLPAPLGTTTPAPGHYTFPLGTGVTLSATTSAGRFFDSWQGQVSSIENPFTLELTDSVIVQPVFGRLASVAIDVRGQGSVDPESVSVPEGSDVALTATPAEGWAFVGWEGDFEGAANPLAIGGLQGNLAVTAVFRELAPVTTDTTGSGAITVLVPDDEGAPVPATPPFFVGDTILLQAVPGPDAALFAWEGDVTGNVNPVERTLTGPLSVTAVFRDVVDATLTVSGEGLVAPGSGTYFVDETVTFEAIPAAGWEFDGWEGDLAELSNPAEVTLSADLSATARFVNPSELVTAVSGGGWMSPAPGRYRYDTPRTVELKAFPDPGWRFVRWEGDVTGATTPLEVFVEEAVSVTAVFAFGSPPPGTASLVIAVEGEGSTAPAPATHVYPVGAEATVTAMPADGWTFAGWRTGTGQTLADNPVTVTVDENQSLRAVFERETMPFGCVPPEEPQTPAGASALLPFAALVALAVLRRSRTTRRSR